MDLAFVESLAPAGPEALSNWRDSDAWLAGGTWLFSAPQPGVRRLHDLHGFGWPPLVAGDAGLEIAATCTLARLRGFEAPRWPAAALLCRAPELLLASFKIWEQATVGGNLCLALPAGSLIAVTAALDGRCTVWGPGEAARSIAVTELVTGAAQTSLAPGELLRAVTLPAAALRGRVAVRQASLTPRGRSAALVVGRQDPGGATTICVTASVPRPLVLRWPDAPSPGELADALLDADPDWCDDVHGDPRWRRMLTFGLAEAVRAELESG